MNDQLSRLKQAQQARRETLAQFRANQIKEFALPSGTVVFVRDVTLTDLMLTGKLPDSVLDMAQEADKYSADIDLKAIAKNGTEFKMLLDLLIRLCMVEPPIADVGDDEHLGIDEISSNDKMAIYTWVNREVEQIKPFREGEAEPVAIVQPSDGLRLETEPILSSGNGDREMELG